MTATTTTLPRYTREYVNLSDLLDALALTEGHTEDIHAELDNLYTWGDAAATLASTAGVSHAIERALSDDPERIRTALALLDGVDFINLEG